MVFPILNLDNNWLKVFSEAQNVSIENQCPIYLTIDEKDIVHGESKESLSREILKLGGRLASIDEVCTEFDTEYENIGT